MIGAGQAGLAMGYYLAQEQRTFVILDAGPEAGHVWRTRYDSLRLFTPAQYDNLPGLPFPAAQDVYPTKDQVAEYLAQYIASFALPVRFGVRVTELSARDDHYSVRTDEGTYTANQIVVATGPFQQPYVPPFAAGLAPDVFQVHSSTYRNPEQLPAGDVLVVGAGNSGAQIAAELVQSHAVYLAQGTRPLMLPQRVLGNDLFWWLHLLGVMKVSADSRLGRRLRRADPLIGASIRRLVREHGLDVVGRILQARGTRVTSSDGRVLEVAAIIWATGFRPDYRWITVPVFDDRGSPVHRRGVTADPGLYFLGLPWLSRRDSALLGGVGRDAEYLAAQIARHAAGTSAGDVISWRTRR